MRHATMRRQAGVQPGHLSAGRSEDILGTLPKRANEILFPAFFGQNAGHRRCARGSQRGNRVGKE